MRFALAAQQAGGARRCLDDAVAYAKDRYQFGRAIGSFQGPKHRMAVMFQRAQSAYVAVRKAADLLDAGDADAAEAVDVAAVWCGPAYIRNAAESLDIHGGIGFTVEMDCHLHIRRSRAAAALFGGTGAARRGVAERLLPA
ncbi:acyl-CoA dehydrogenase family protein [Tsukamurella ocularis]|uniref:acyl-CoA dehydrogenase family protein n=1 Tax=Tsukamurella ocularis TaxID=1970234 RepID=UPI0039F0A859